MLVYLCLREYGSINLMYYSWSVVVYKSSLNLNVNSTINLSNLTHKCEEEMFLEIIYCFFVTIATKYNVLHLFYCLEKYCRPHTIYLKS